MNVTERPGRQPLSPQEDWISDDREVLRSDDVLSVGSVQHLHHIDAQASSVSEKHGALGHRQSSGSARCSQQQPPRLSAQQAWADSESHVNSHPTPASQ